MHRRIYGVLDLGPPPTLLVATAASPDVAALLQEGVRAVAQAQAQQLVVHDLVPLPQSDSAGATAFSVVLSLIVAGILGSTIIYLVTQRRTLAVHLAALIVLAAGAGVLTALVTNGIVGAFSGQFLAIGGVATLFVLAMVMPIAAFQALLGVPGSAVGLLLFFVVGAPSSGRGTAPQLLPDPWRVISQGLPPGAAVTARRRLLPRPWSHSRTTHARRLRRPRSHRSDHPELGSHQEARRSTRREVAGSKRWWSSSWIGAVANAAASERSGRMTFRNHRGSASLCRVMAIKGSR